MDYSTLLNGDPLSLTGPGGAPLGTGYNPFTDQSTFWPGMTEAPDLPVTPPVSKGFANEAGLRSNPFDIIGSGTFGPAMYATYQLLGLGTETGMLHPGQDAPINHKAPWSGLGFFVDPITEQKWMQLPSGEWDTTR